MSGYGAVNLNNSMAARAEAVEARAAGEGGLYGDVLVGRDSTIIKPISIPNAPLPNRKAIRYTVKAGDTLESVARLRRHVQRDHVVESWPAIAAQSRPDAQAGA